MFLYEFDFSLSGIMGGFAPLNPPMRSGFLKSYLEKKPLLVRTRLEKMLVPILITPLVPLCGLPQRGWLCIIRQYL